MSTPTPTVDSIFTPVIVKVSNFQPIDVNTNIQIDFMQMLTVRNYNNDGSITVGIYQ